MFQDDSFLTFWGHIEELRKVLLRVFIIILIGFLVCFFFYQTFFQILIPVDPTSSLLVKETWQHERIMNKSNQLFVYTLPEKAILDGISQGVISVDPFSYSLQSGQYIDYRIPVTESKLILLSPLEGIMLTIKVCFWLSLAFTSPLWGFILLGFILPALNGRQKYILIPFFVGSLLCMAIGIGLAHFITIPLANQYLEGFNSGLGKNLWSLSHYIDYTLIISVGHIVAAEIGLILIFGVHYRIIKVDWLIEKKRYMIVVAFILGAILTPPDIITQLLVAIPLVLIYEMAILYGKIRKFSHI